MRRVRDALNCILVSGDAGVHDDGRYFGLLHEILGRSSAEIDDAGGFRLRHDLRGFHYVADHIECEAIAAFIAIRRDTDTDGAVGNSRTIQWNAGLGCRRYDPVFLAMFAKLQAEQIEEL